MWTVTNTTLDHTKSMLMRRAPKLVMEPVIAGQRLRLRSSLVLSDAQFEHNRADLEKLSGQGVLDFKQMSQDKPSKKIEAAPVAEVTPPPPPPPEKAPEEVKRTPKKK